MEAVKFGTDALLATRRKENADAILASYYGFTPRTPVEKVAELAMEFAYSQVKVVDEKTQWEHAENFRSYITLWKYDWECRLEGSIENNEIKEVEDFFKSFGFFN